MVDSDSQVTGATERRVKYGLSVSVFILSLLVILIVLNWLSAEAPVRWDLTASRAYSLSPQTNALLERLDEDLEIVLLFEEEIDTVRALRSQVDDVLDEFGKRSSRLNVTQIDPTNPRSIAQLEKLLDRLKATFASDITDYEAVINDGRAAIGDLKTFAETELTWLMDVGTDLDASDPNLRSFAQVRGILAAIPQEVDILSEQVEKDLETGAARPLEDWEGATSTLRAITTQRSRSMASIAEFYQTASQGDTLPPRMADGLPASAARFATMADRLAEIDERIENLSELRITPIARQLATRNCILLMAADDATVLRFEELFPMPSMYEVESKQRLDLRFSGEQVIAKGIRRLVVKDMPTVVFCHVEPRASMMNRRETPNIARVADLLRDLGFEVTEWNALGGGRPDVPTGRGNVVWVMVPQAPSGFGPQANEANVQLAQFAGGLIEEGENVLVSMFPNPLVGFGQADEWSLALQPLGLDVNSSEVVMRVIPQPGRPRDERTALFTVDEYRTEHLLGKTLDTIHTSIAYPIPLRTPAPDGDGDPDAASASNVIVTPLMEITPDEQTWVSTNWANPSGDNPPETPDADPYVVAVAVERGLSGGTQRAIVVGSGSWLWTRVVEMETFYGSSWLPLSPGNSELFANAVCWLAERDDLVAASALTQSVALVEGLEASSQTLWRLLLIGGLPILTLVAGIGLYMMRRG